jgi:hypothetical protein
VRWGSAAPAHVIAAADQPSVQSMVPSSSSHGTAPPGLVGVAVGADDAVRAPSPTTSFRESNPARPAERVLLACFLLARTGPLGHVGRPDGTGIGAVGHRPAASARAASSAARRDDRPVGGGSRTDASPRGGLGNSSRVSRLLQIGPEARTATVSTLPASYTWSKRFSGLHSLLVSPTTERPRSDVSLPRCGGGVVGTGRGCSPLVLARERGSVVRVGA